MRKIDVREGRWYTREDTPGRRVKITRIWTNDLGNTGVAYDILNADKTGGHSALPLAVFARAYRPV